jgi:hypothetical protein
MGWHAWGRLGEARSLGCVTPAARRPAYLLVAPLPYAWKPPSPASPSPPGPAGVIKLGEERSQSKCTLVYGQMNEPPGARARVALTGLTVAEYFRDIEGQDVLLFVDNIFRFTQANSEVSALLGRIPSAVGYQPTLATDLGGLQERITTTTKGSITSVQVRAQGRSMRTVCCGQARAGQPGGRPARWAASPVGGQPGGRPARCRAA